MFLLSSLFYFFHSRRLLSVKLIWHIQRGWKTSLCRPSTKCSSDPSGPMFVLCCSEGSSFSQWTLNSINLTCFYFPNKTHPLIKTKSLLSEKPGTPTPSHNFPMMLHFLPFVSVSIRSPLLPSSSFPHPGRRALSACVPASHGGPGIWPRSDPGTPTRPSSAPAPCNVAVRTSCGRHWSYWEEREARRRSDFLKHKCLKFHHISCVNMHLNMMSGQCLHKVSFTWSNYTAWSAGISIF